MRTAIYARYSTDLQSDASIEDQLRICRRLIEQYGWSVAESYIDAGLSGASHLRPGYQQMLQDARSGSFDAVVSEGLDRISRDQEHIASFYKQMVFQNVQVVTVAEGEISELHIGLKGTMSSLFLKDLAQKTRRGLEGRVRKGKSAGGLTYGYNVVRAVREDGSFTTGERQINTAHAEIVRRIFREFVNGKSPRALAAALNAEGVPGPRGTWGASSIHGNAKRGTGILNNELYLGRLVWNRQRFVKDPATGRRQARPNRPEEWVIEDVPGLRILDDALWNAAKARQSASRNTAISEGISKAKRAVHLFSGLLKCGKCGSGFILLGKSYYGCAATRNKGTCDNRLTVRKDELENRVLTGLKEELLHPDLIAEFARVYQEEFNRMAGENGRERDKAVKDLATVHRQIERIVDAISEGMFHASMKSRMDALETRKAALEAQIAAEPERQPVLLHPSLAERYRSEVARLSEALNQPCMKAEATTLIRSLLTEIRMFPEDGVLAIELVGELAGLLALGDIPSKKPRARATGRSTLLVAGGRINLDRTTAFLNRP